jgi:hypothetical protein
MATLASVVVEDLSEASDEEDTPTWGVYRPGKAPKTNRGFKTDSCLCNRQNERRTSKGTASVNTIGEDHN